MNAVLCLLIFSCLLLNGQMLWAHSECSDSFHELNQNDPRFEQAKLFSSSGESKLCGPVCIMQAIYQLGLLSEKDLPEKMIEMVVNEFPAWGIYNVPERGMNTFELESALESQVLKLGSEVLLETKLYHLTESDLFLANSKDVVVIAIHEGWGALDEIQLASPENRTAGHFVILSGIQKLDRSSFSISMYDPLFGRIRTYLELSPTASMPTPNSYRLRFMDPKAVNPAWTGINYIRLLTQLIVIKRIGP